MPEREKDLLEGDKKVFFRRKEIRVLTQIKLMQ
jgi:hypothetical protein